MQFIINVKKGVPSAVDSCIAWVRGRVPVHNLTCTNCRGWGSNPGPPFQFIINVNIGNSYACNYLYLFHIYPNFRDYIICFKFAFDFMTGLGCNTLGQSATSEMEWCYLEIGMENLQSIHKINVSINKFFVCSIVFAFAFVNFI